jgi:hypothetical protein
MDRLRDPSGGRLSVVLANGGGIAPTALEIQQQIVPIEIVCRSLELPGTSSDRPVVVVSDQAYHAARSPAPDPLNAVQTTREMWIRVRRTVVARLRNAGVGSYLTITADRSPTSPSSRPRSAPSSLDVLGRGRVALGAGRRGRVPAGGPLPRILSMALSTRMGLGPGTMRGSLVLELMVVLFAALAVGVATGLVGAAIVIPYLDPLPTIPPGPIDVVPWIEVAAAAVGLAVAAFVGGVLAGRVARDVPLGEVLRVAE